MSASPTAGAIVSQRYRLDRLLGEGGMGAVWAATHLVTHKLVALKFLKSTAQTEQTTRRFLREARVASAIQHPNVVEIHDVLEHEGQPVMVMDLLNGESLGGRLARDGSLPLPDFARIMLPVVSAIGSAHAAGIVHRDLKPDNIFLSERPDGDPEPKVLDFGIAKLSAPEGAAAATAHLTSTGAVMGTPYYMAPEQVFGEKDLDQQADVWAMGVISYECLSGRKPFDGDNVGQLFKAVVTGEVTPLEQVAPHLPKDVTDAIGRLLKKERKERSPDLRELYQILKRYSSIQAESFGSAGSIAPPRIDASSPHNPLPAASNSIADAALAGTIHLPLERRRWAAVAGGSLVGVLALAAIAFFALRTRDTVNPPVMGAALVEAPAAPAAPIEKAPEPARPAEPVAAPSASVDAGRVEPRRAASAGPARPGAPASAAETQKPPPAAAPTRAPGTVVESVPF